MADREDTLRLHDAPDRVLYSTGQLLDVGDLHEDQDYHRGRLARALAALHGPGTVAGLRVEFAAHSAAVEGSPPDQIKVRPGLALDAMGRLIEVPRSWCIRVDPWWASHDPDALLAARHAADPAHGVLVLGVVADVVLRFAVCERARTPAFRSGPFDALDGVQPSRLRDQFTLSLELVLDPTVIRAGTHGSHVTLTTARDRRVDILEAVLNAWEDRDDPHAVDATPDFGVFLARVAFPADANGTRLAAPPQVHNHLRDFVLPTGALQRWVAHLDGRVTGLEGA